MLTPVHDPTPPHAANAKLPVQHPSAERVAVLLNRNARRVTDKLAQRIERIVGRDHFFYSHSLEEAESYSREIVQRGYGTVVCGGGDGTLAQAVNQIHRYIVESNAWRSERHERFGETQTLLGMPRFAFLPLGTGNGLRRVVGCRDPLDALHRIVDFSPGRVCELPMIHDGQGEHFLFGGLGYDAQLLNDYNWLKARTHNKLLKPFMQTVLGYFGALFARTLPRILSGQHQEVEARITTTNTAYYIDPRRGDRVQELEPGTTLFEGTASMLGVGTSSFYGYGFRVFPFAGMMPGMMQLRVSKLGAVHALARLPAIWRGHYRNPHLIHDFLVQNVRIELTSPHPFQHSGDDQGLRDQLDLRIADDTLKLVDFYKPRPFL